VGRGVRLVGPSAEKELGCGMGRCGAWAKLGRVWASYWVWFSCFGLGWVSFLFLFLFKLTQPNLFEFKIEFEFNSNTQTNKTNAPA
jgi:hypothetical protein